MRHKAKTETVKLADILTEFKIQSSDFILGHLSAITFDEWLESKLREVDRNARRAAVAEAREEHDGKTLLAIKQREYERGRAEERERWLNQTANGHDSKISQKIKNDLLTIADLGEYEDLRREVEKYFGKPDLQKEEKKVE